MPQLRRAFSSVDRKYTPSKGREYIWQDEAACEGSDLNDFMYVQRDEPGYRALPYITKWGKTKVRDERTTNKIKLEASAKTCQSCPVSRQCLDTASKSDLFWSLRGGRLPGVLTERMIKAPASDVSDYFDWECKTHGRKWLSKRWREETQKMGFYCTECAK